MALNRTRYFLNGKIRGGIRGGDESANWEQRVPNEDGQGWGSSGHRSSRTLESTVGFERLHPFGTPTDSILANFVDEEENQGSRCNSLAHA